MCTCRSRAFFIEWVLGGVVRFSCHLRLPSCKGVNAPAPHAAPRTNPPTWCSTVSRFHGALRLTDCTYYTNSKSMSVPLYMIM